MIYVIERNQSYTGISQDIIDFEVAAANGGPLTWARTAGSVPEGHTFTQHEINAGFEAVRQFLHQQTSDPMYFRWRRGEVTEQAWLDAVAAVKTAWPTPTI